MKKKALQRSNQKLSELLSQRGQKMCTYIIHQHVHFASFIPERSPFYDMIRGYFDLRKIQLKVLQSQFSLFNLVNIDEIFQKN